MFRAETFNIRLMSAVAACFDIRAKTQILHFFSFSWGRTSVQPRFRSIDRHRGAKKREKENASHAFMYADIRERERERDLSIMEADHY